MKLYHSYDPRVYDHSVREMLHYIALNNIFGQMFDIEIYFLRYEFFPSPIFGLVQTDRRTESDAYEPILQIAQLGSKRSLVYSQPLIVWTSEYLRSG